MLMCKVETLDWPMGYFSRLYKGSFPFIQESVTACNMSAQVYVLSYVHPFHYFYGNIKES